MRGPFPGMDPYLEHPAVWPSVHNRLIYCIADLLQPLLLPRYVAKTDERVFVEGAQRERIPDVWVEKVRPDGSRGGAAVAEPATDTPLLVEVAELEIHEGYIEIVDRYRNMQVVTVIEVLSPSNKTPGPGQDSYRQKQREVIAAECHLVEIDCLRRGQHVLTVPNRPERQHDYLACVNRTPNRTTLELYPWTLRQRLPRISLPLAEPDKDVPLDLQAALDQAYWSGRYMTWVRYEDPCDPSLSQTDQQWAWEQWRAYKTAHPELFT